MKRIFRQGLTAAVLLAAACMKDGPVSPDAGQVSLRVQFQAATNGSAVQIFVLSVLPDSEQVLDTLFNGTFPVSTGTQQVTAAFDLTSCLARQRSVGAGAFCIIEVELALLNNGEIVDQQFLGTMQVRPGQVVQTQPVVLTAGNHAPTITATDVASEVEGGLLRYHITASDSDGDIIQLLSTDLQNGLPDRSTQISFYPPLRTVDGNFYAFKSDTVLPNELHTSFIDSKFNSSPGVDIPVGPALGDAAVDSMGVDTTADSLIVGVRSTSDSLEIVVRNLDDGRADSLYFVCGGNVPLGAGSTARRVACRRQVPFTQALAIVVPIDAAGNAGQGMRCPVPNTVCTLGIVPDRIARRRQ